MEALIARYSLREELHHQLLVSLYRSGRQGEALAAYRRARQLLADELGVDPGRPLQQLEAAILAQDPRLDWTPPVGQLPAQSTGALPAPTSPADLAAAPASTDLVARPRKIVLCPHHLS